jgi:endonuclease III
MHVKAHNLTVKDVPAVTASGEALWQSVAATIDFASVNEELTAISECRDADPIRHAQKCLAFAILSPRCKLHWNATMVQRFFSAIDAGEQFESCDDLYQTIAYGIGGIGVGPNVARLYASLDAIADVTPDDMTKPTLLAWRKARYIMGIGEKTAAMAVALFEQTSPVFTLDVHMLRWITDTVWGTTASEHSIADTAYKVLEPWFVQWAARYFPAQSPFSVQWAIWNVRQGNHETHLPIFGL